MDARGPCKENPDRWFPELPQGRRTQETTNRLRKEINEVIAICQACPFKAPCKAEGMKPHNLNYGIWGGMLEGERMLEAGVDPSQWKVETQKGIAFSMLAFMKPEMKFWWRD